MEQLFEQMKQLNAEQGKIRYRITRNGIKILTSDRQTFDTVHNYCKETKLYGFTHTPKEDRFVRFVMHGLSPIDEDTILNEFKRHKIQPEKVKLLCVNKTYPDEATYVVYFKNSQKIALKDLQRIGLFNLVPRFEYFHNKDTRNYVQCSNCQQLSHGTANCFNPPVCVRCAGPHKSSKCDLLPPPKMDDDNNPIPTEKYPKIEVDKLFCALCKKQGHSAAYRNCEVKIKYQKDLENLKKARNSAKPSYRIAQRDFPEMITEASYETPLTNQVFANQSYSQAAQGASSHAPAQRAQTLIKAQRADQQKPAQRANQQKPAQRAPSNLLSPDECLQLFDYFTTELQRCSTPMEQIKLIAKLSFEQVHKYSLVNSP